MNAKWSILNFALIVIYVKIISIHVEIMMEDTGLVWIFLPIIASFLLGVQLVLIYTRISKFFK